MQVNPRGVWVGDHFEYGLKCEIANGRLASTSASTSEPENLWISPAFVNAHSHLEYRPHLRNFGQQDYWPWIRNLAAVKADEDLQVVEEYTRLAAKENHAAGIGWIGEHSDRPFSAEPLIEHLTGGRLFFELITFSSPGEEQAKIALILEKHEIQARQLEKHPSWSGILSPHATWTVNPEQLSQCAKSPGFLSIHVAETSYEEEFFAAGSGPISELYSRMNLKIPRISEGVMGYLRDCGMIRKNTQYVHACDINPAYISELSEAGVSIAHCPRSNEALMCPDAPIREFLDAGMQVGLGLDSPASSGVIDMFEEMRAADRTAKRRDQCVTPEEIWKMATNMGAASLALEGYENTRWIAIRSKTETPEELIATATAKDVSWL